MSAPLGTDPHTNPRGAASSASTDFSCGICFDTAVEPVVTKCGHLYCWTCLDQWLQRGALECPMCKGCIDVNTPGDVIPLYGKGRAGAGTAGHPPPHPSTTTSQPSTSSSTTPRAQDAFGARPRANREQPARDRNINFAMQGGWGGGMVFFFANPSFLTWPMMLALATILFVYKFAPWRQWLGWEPPQQQGNNQNDANANGGGGRGAQAPAAGGGGGGAAANNGARNFTEIAMLVAMISLFLWVTGFD